MTTATIVTATVKYGAGLPRETQYGMRINALMVLPDGTEQRLWGNPGDVAIASLKKGQTVQLLHDGKGYKLLDNQPEPTKPISTELTPEHKKAISIYVNGQADLLKYCWDTARIKLEGIATEEESIRCAASSLFNAAQKKFNL
jgi:hypothetical protein